MALRGKTAKFIKNKNKAETHHLSVTGPRNRMTQCYKKQTIRQKVHILPQQTESFTALVIDRQIDRLASAL